MKDIFGEHNPKTFQPNWPDGMYAHLQDDHVENPFACLAAEGFDQLLSGLSPLGGTIWSLKWLNYLEFRTSKRSARQ
jgi:hypothetical protein